MANKNVKPKAPAKGSEKSDPKVEAVKAYKKGAKEKKGSGKKPNVKGSCK